MPRLPACSLSIMLKASILLIVLLISLVDTRSPYMRCFQKTVQRSIDNAQPMFELFYVTPYQCIDQCILAANNNAPNAKVCRSFVYDHSQHSCRLFDQDGNQPPAIMHPAEEYDYYRRTAVFNQCAGPVIPMGPSLFVQSPSNPNFYALKMTSTGEVPWRSRVHGSALTEHVDEHSAELPASEGTIQQLEPINYKSHIKNFKQSQGRIPPNQPGSKVEKEVQGPKQPHMRLSFANHQPQAETGGTFFSQPNSLTNLANNEEADLNYETSRSPRLIQPRKHVTTTSPSSEDYNELIFESEDALRAQPARVHAVTASAVRSTHRRHPVEPTKRPSYATASPARISREPHCPTSTAYYVVIGNEMILPMSSDDSDITVIQRVAQSQCAKYCSANKGADGEPIQCSSINYFPLTRKCELYGIFAEPHGPGSLVENDDVIYFEKFCLPVKSAECHEDEMFILYVQKKVLSEELDVKSANSISTCLRHCLQTHMCKSAAFDSNGGRCHLHSVNIAESPSAVKGAPFGWVLIENACGIVTTRPHNQHSSHDYDNTISLSEAQWTEWTDCQFKLRGKLVRVRTRQCEVECPDGGLQVAPCY